MEGHGEAAEYLFCDAVDAADIRQIGEDDRELVAAQAGYCIGFAYTFGNASRRLLQQLVTAAVAHRVVDLLEAVEVDEQQ